MRNADGNNMQDMSGYKASAIQLACFGLEDHILVLQPAESVVVPNVLGLVHCPEHKIPLSPCFL